MDLEKVKSDLAERRTKDKRSDQDIPDARKICKAGDKEGIEMLISWLPDQGSRWQQIAVASLPWVPHLKGDIRVIEPIRQLLIKNDPSFDHIRAATALGELSEWPDDALSFAMQNDESIVVRGEAFRAALMLAGVSYVTAREYAGQVENGQIRATPELVDRIAKKKS